MIFLKAKLTPHSRILFITIASIGAYSHFRAFSAWSGVKYRQCSTMSRRYSESIFAPYPHRRAPSAGLPHLIFMRFKTSPAAVR